MAQFNYAPLVATANRLVKQFGKSNVTMAIVRNVADTPDDPDKPWRGTAATIKEFVFLGLAFTTTISSADNDQTVYAPGDLSEVAATGDPGTLCGSPTTSDYVRIGSDYYSIIGVQDVTPDNKPAIFTMKCRAWPLLTRQPSTPF